MNKDTIKIKQALEAAFSIEIGRVSELPYSSREICRHFFSDVRDRFLAALSAEQQEEAQPIGWVKSGELADCRKKRQSVNLWPIKYSDLDMPVYAAPVTVQPASKPILPDGYTAKHVDGHGWLIDPPNGSRWIAFDDTPVGDLIADLTRSATSKKASAPARDDVLPELPEPLGKVEAFVPHPNGVIGRVINETLDPADNYYDADQMHDYAKAAVALQAHPAQAGKEASEAAQEPLTEWLESDAGKAAMQHAGAIAAQAAQPCRDDVIEECAKLCDTHASEMWRLYKHGHGVERANPHTEGVSDGAEECAQMIRALRTQPQATTAEPSVPVQAVTLTESEIISIANKQQRLRDYIEVGPVQKYAIVLFANDIARRLLAGSAKGEAE